MNTMTYKGYLGSVAYSEKDNLFYGKKNIKKLAFRLEMLYLCI